MEKGSNSSSQSYFSSLSFKKYSVTANYSESKGAAILSASGVLVPTPLGSLITSDFLTFNAKSYGIGASARLKPNLTMSGGYVNFSSGTSLAKTGSVTSNLANGNHYNIHAEYKMRRFDINGGYDRGLQAISSLPGGPRVINSYFVSISRWFNIF
jgi:hypothetical protein